MRSPNPTKKGQAIILIGIFNYFTFRNSEVLKRTPDKMNCPLRAIRDLLSTSSGFVATLLTSISNFILHVLGK